MCDGSQDCPNGEDEQKCKIICDHSKFTCSAQTNDTLDFCINKKHVCDGQRDCPKGEDEKDCPKKKECDEESKCSQLCIESVEGKQGCACHNGYMLDEDGLT